MDWKTVLMNCWFGGRGRNVLGICEGVYSWNFGGEDDTVKVNSRVQYENGRIFEVGKSHGQYNHVGEQVLRDKEDVSEYVNELIKPKYSFEEELKMDTMKCDLDT